MLASLAMSTTQRGCSVSSTSPSRLRPTLCCLLLTTATSEYGSRTRRKRLALCPQRNDKPWSTDRSLSKSGRRKNMCGPLPNAVIFRQASTTQSRRSARCSSHAMSKKTEGASIPVQARRNPRPSAKVSLCHIPILTCLRSRHQGTKVRRPPLLYIACHFHPSPTTTTATTPTDPEAARQHDLGGEARTDLERSARNFSSQIQGDGQQRLERLSSDQCINTIAPPRWSKRSQAHRRGVNKQVIRAHTHS